MRKLFYEDSHCAAFSAAVTGCHAAGAHWEVTLDATAFYPEGGGQACDLGTLGGVTVLDVRERDGQIIHLCDSALPVGRAVQGQIDWARRFDLMQQHTGEHILSGLIHRYLGYHNTGFHVGADVMEVDFDGPISAELLERIEQEANEAVWADIPLKCWIPDPGELETVTYRTKRALPWPVRIVQVPGFDSCACCGVHVKRTGEVGLIKILSCTKFHGGVRLELVCGGRAYRYMARIFRENRLVSQAFSAQMDATGKAAQRMNETLAAQKQQLTALQERLFDSIAEHYVDQKDVILFEPGLSGGALRSLADKLAGVITGCCAVFSRHEEGYGYCLASRTEDLRPLNRSMTQALDGRGGGKPNFQQGSVRSGEVQIRDFFAQYFR